MWGTPLDTELLMFMPVNKVNKVLRKVVRAVVMHTLYPKNWSMHNKTNWLSKNDIQSLLYNLIGLLEPSQQNWRAIRSAVPGQSLRNHCLSWAVLLLFHSEPLGPPHVLSASTLKAQSSPCRRSS